MEGDEWSVVSAIRCLRSYAPPADSLPRFQTGQYVGTRPVKISRATSAVAAVNIGDRKAKLYDAKVQKKGGT